MEDFQDFQIIDNCLMVRMPEEVDHHRASYICEGADRLLVRENVENVVFDFEDTRFMDSSGINPAQNDGGERHPVALKEIFAFARMTVKIKNRKVGARQKLGIILFFICCFAG